MIHPSVFIAPGAQVIGRVSLGEEVSIWFGAVVRADVDEIALGRACNIQDRAVLHVSRGCPLVLEDYVSVGHGAILHGCRIGAGTLVGMGAVILDGARVGPGAVVGAGTLILENQEIPPRVLVVGQPARVVRELTAAEILNARDTAFRYVQYAARYRNGEWPLEIWEGPRGQG